MAPGLVVPPHGGHADPQGIAGQHVIVIGQQGQLVLVHSPEHIPQAVAPVGTDIEGQGIAQPRMRGRQQQRIVQRLEGAFQHFPLAELEKRIGCQAAGRSLPALLQLLTQGSVGRQQGSGLCRGMEKDETVTPVQAGQHGRRRDLAEARPPELRRMPKIIALPGRIRHVAHIQPQQRQGKLGTGLPLLRKQTHKVPVPVEAAQRPPFQRDRSVGAVRIPFTRWRRAGNFPHHTLPGSFAALCRGTVVPAGRGIRLPCRGSHLRCRRFLRRRQQGSGHGLFVSPVPAGIISQQ